MHLKDVFINAGINYVISTTTAIEDTAVNCFSQTFYNRLFKQGSTIQGAFNEAVNDLKSAES
jgi:hypothetical protein